MKPCAADQATYDTLLANYNPSFALAYHTLALRQFRETLCIVPGAYIDDKAYAHVVAAQGLLLAN